MLPPKGPDKKSKVSVVPVRAQRMEGVEAERVIPPREAGSGITSPRQPDVRQGALEDPGLEEGAVEGVPGGRLHPAPGVGVLPDEEPRFQRKSEYAFIKKSLTC